MLEPGEVFLMVFPSLVFELLRRQKLLICTLLMVEYEKQCIQLQLRCVDHRRRFWETCMTRIRCPQQMELRFLPLLILNLVRPTHLQHLGYFRGILLLLYIHAHIRQVRKGVHIFVDRWYLHFLFRSSSASSARNFYFLAFHYWGRSLGVLLAGEVKFFIDLLELGIDVTRVRTVLHELHELIFDIPYFVELNQEIVLNVDLDQFEFLAVFPEHFNPIFKI